MSKFIGLFLLVGAIFLILVIGRTSPWTPTAQRPSETPVSQQNVKIGSGQSSVPSTGGTGTTISNPPKSEGTPLSEKVYISFVSFSGYPNEYSRITLYGRLREGETLDITGWRIKSNKREIVIPKAVEIYNPDGSTPATDIILKPNNYVELYSLTSPLSRNLRPNKCMGYLTEIYNSQSFYFPKNCPSFPRSEIRYLSGQCQSYIQSLAPCQTPDINFYNTLPGTDEGNACRAFLQNINYGNCFRNHQNDADFLSDFWLVWLNEQILNSQHDYLRLYDKEGNLISEYSY